MYGKQNDKANKYSLSSVSGRETSVSLLLMTSNEGLEDSIVAKVVRLVADFDEDVYGVVSPVVVKFPHWTLTIPPRPPTIRIIVWI